jgi:predicted RNase H-like HicB family nuclease
VTTYRMIDDGYPNFKKIKVGKKWVGRVCKHAEGGYLATINQKPMIAERGATEREAFERAASKALGFSSPEEVRVNNARVRRQKAEVKQRSRYVVDQLVNHSNLEPLFEMLKNER